MERIKIILPIGSLNRRDRGNTNELLESAGYQVTGYEPGNESERLLSIDDPEIFLRLGRPQNAPYQLRDRGADAAIIGEDWFKDANLTGAGVRKIGDLGYGEVKIVVVVSDDAPYSSLEDFFLSKKDEKGQIKEPIICYSEYVNLAADYFRNNDGYKKLFGDAHPVIEIDGHKSGDNPNVIIRKSYGHTEAFVGNEAEISVDNMHTGNTLREYNLRSLEQIMESCAGFYAGPDCVGPKERKAYEIYGQLRKVYGIYKKLREAGVQ